jgi:hypothetical protein
MPRYFFDVKDGHRLFDASGFVCEDDTDAIIRATVLAIGVSLDTPEDDPERRIAIINDAGRDWQRARIFQAFTRKSGQIRWCLRRRLQLSAKPCVRCDGLHRVAD